MKIKNEIILSVGGIFLFLFILNILLPPQSDDLDAYFMANDGIRGGIRSYMHWNGRIGEFLFMSFVGRFNPLLFDFINAIFGTFFIVGIFILTFGKFPKDKLDSNILLLIILLLMAFASFGANFLWGSGSLNYLWGLSFILLFLFSYRFYFSFALLDSKLIKILNGGGRSKNTSNKTLFKHQNKLALLSILIAPFAGLASEQIGLLVIISLLFFTLVLIASKINPPLWYYLGFGLFILGWLTLYFSPGHASRAMNYPNYLSISNLLALSFEEKINRVLYTLKGFKSYLFTLFCFIVVNLAAFLVLKNKFKKVYFFGLYILISVIMFVVANNFWLANYILVLGLIIILFKNEKENKNSLLFVIFLCSTYIICAFSTLQVGLPHRARLGDISIIIMMIIIFYKIFKMQFLNKAILGITLIYGIYVGSAYIDHRLKWSKMIASIEKQKENGIRDIVVDKNTFKSFYKNFENWGNPDNNPATWPNGTYARYFEVDSFRAN